jgi:hypothetical protein
LPSGLRRAGWVPYFALRASKGKQASGLFEFGIQNTENKNYHHRDTESTEIMFFFSFAGRYRQRKNHLPLRGNGIRNFK